ncbi:tRNA(adenine34) deaminase [Malassezia pachydermatis]
MIGCATYVPKEAQAEADLRWMRLALDMAQEAFDHNEVPVGCVFVQNGTVIAKGRNRTNELMNVRTLLLTDHRPHDMLN